MIQDMVRRHYRDLVPYTPIVPTGVLSKAEGLSETEIIKLDGNENLYGPSPKALQAIRSFDSYHIYPDPVHRALRAKLADYVGVPAEHIIAGNGSDEIIDLLMRLFLDPGDIVINCPPSFGMYPFNTQVCAGTLAEITRKLDFTLDIQQIIRQAEDTRAKLIFLTSPNNPTGNLLSAGELQAVLDTGIVVVVDEAYQEFASSQSFVKLAPQHENLVVLRTFSKWAGLAGLRVGYGVLSAELVRILDEIKPPYNVNVAALVAAEASLDDRETLLQRVKLMVQERERLFEKLKSVPYLEPIPSEANFILCRVKGRESAEVKSVLERQGIFIKRVVGPLLDNAVRISVGKPEHTDALMAALAR